MLSLAVKSLQVNPAQDALFSQHTKNLNRGLLRFVYEFMEDLIFGYGPNARGRS